MIHRYLASTVVIVALAFPAYAQRKDRAPTVPDPIQANSAFRALFKSAIEKPARSTVRLQVDGKNVALGTVVSKEGYLLTKASEIGGGPVSVKTSDGRDFDGKVIAKSDVFDLALVKVDASGLTPIEWTSAKKALVGNWVAVPANSGDAVAVGVVSTGAWVPKSGFLGVQLDQTAPEAKISLVVAGSAAEKAGIKPKDVIIRINKQEILTGDGLIDTLQGYQHDEPVTVTLLRDGKQMELLAVLGKRQPEPTPAKGKNRGDYQNNLGSSLSLKRSGIPCFLQTDAVIKPSDCGAPLVDLDGQAVGLTICRAGRTESWAIPTETVRVLTSVMMTAEPGLSREKRVEVAKAALKAAEDAKECVEVVFEAKRFLADAVAEEEWWRGRKIETGPAPSVIEIERGPAPRSVTR